MSIPGPGGRLANKHVVITGAGSGIGGEIAALFAKEGAAVFLVGRDEGKLRRIAEQIGHGARCFPCDIAQEDEVHRLRDAVTGCADTLDVLVNNAGTVLRNENMLNTGSDDWDDFMRINLKGAFLMCRAFLPSLVRSGRGSIVNVASQLAIVAAPGYSTYGTAKGGIVSFTRALAVDFGPSGVRANCVSPGVIETPMAYVDRDNFDELKASIADQLPLRRIGTPADVAYAALFLASEESAWVTGTNLVVDGGFTSK